MTIAAIGLCYFRRNIRVALEFKLQDVWVGVFWKASPLVIDLWICLLPCLPIHITWTRWKLSKEAFLWPQD